jgi:LPPG:FO 2-phospho-L-lactate transferase
MVVVTGDDFEHLGLWISPDVDTALPLGGLCRSGQGLGRSHETWTFMKALESSRTDRFRSAMAIATHVERTAEWPPVSRCRRSSMIFVAASASQARSPMSDDRFARGLRWRGMDRFQDYFSAPAMHAGDIGDRVQRRRRARPEPR